MALQNDAQGFLIGERRLIELRKGVDNVHSNTAEILTLLKAQLNELSSQQTQQQRQKNKLNDAIVTAIKSKPAINVSVHLPKNTKPTRQTGINASTVKVQGNIPNSAKATKSTVKNTQKCAVSGANVNYRLGARVKETDGNTAQSVRDSQGRFTGSAKSINEKSFATIINKAASSAGAGVNTGGIDPTLDAVRELGSLISPAKGAFRLMGRGALWLYKKDKPKRNEDLPMAQQDHNTEVERNNTETRKLFRKLIDAVNRLQNKGGGLFSKLPVPIPGRSGRNGKSGRNTPTPIPGKRKGGPAPVPLPGKDGHKDGGKPGKLGKLGKVLGGLGRKLPLVGALVGGGMLASQWADMDAAEKGGGIGSMIGGGIGGVAGAFLGPVGAVAGATIGSTIGDVVGQKVGRWTESLKGQDVGGTIVKGWNNTLDGINKMVDAGIKGLGKYGSNMAGYGAAGGGFMLASFSRRGSGGGYSGGGSSGGSSGGTPSNYNPDNEVPIKRVLEAGKGYNIVELADGSVIRQDGDWNWRNRNAGNIEDGDFAKASGRVDQSDAKGSKGTKRFAAFPTFAAGRKAKEKLIFESKNYRNLDLMGAIENYAPWKENNTKAYQQHVLNAVGSNKRMSEYTAAEREKIMNAIQQKEGSLKQGKVTVIKPPSNTANAASLPQPKFVSVSATPARIEGKPMFVSDYPKASKPVELEKPNTMRRISSKPEQSVMMASTSTNNISQLPADRDIAHAITGGLGMRTLYA